MLNDRVKRLIEARKTMALDTVPVLEALKDKSVPLDERWAAYRALVDNYIIVTEQSYGDGELQLLGDSLTQYDNFCNDRGATVRFIDMEDRIIEADSEYDEEDLVAAKHNLPVWKERVLEMGFASFRYDW